MCVCADNKDDGVCQLIEPVKNLTTGEDDEKLSLKEKFNILLTSLGVLNNTSMEDGILHDDEEFKPPHFMKDIVENYGYEIHYGMEKCEWSGVMKLTSSIVKINQLLCDLEEGKMYDEILIVTDIPFNHGSEVFSDFTVVPLDGFYWLLYNGRRAVCMRDYVFDSGLTPFSIDGHD